MTDEKKIFIAVLITSFMGPFMGSSINIAIPTMAAEFAVPAQELSWVVTAYLLGSVALLVPFGRPRVIAEKIRELAADPARYAAMSLAARQLFLSGFTRESHLNRLIESLNQPIT